MADYSEMTITVAIHDQSGLCQNCAQSVFDDFDEEEGTESMSPTGKLTKSMQKTVETFCRAKASFYKRAKKLASKQNRKGKAKA